jgi:hypothetical protein
VFPEVVAGALEMEAHNLPVAGERPMIGRSPPDLPESLANVSGAAPILARQ